MTESRAVSSSKCLSERQSQGISSASSIQASLTGSDKPCGGSPSGWVVGSARSLKRFGSFRSAPVTRACSGVNRRAGISISPKCTKCGRVDLPPPTGPESKNWQPTNTPSLCKLVAAPSMEAEGRDLTRFAHSRLTGMLWLKELQTYRAHPAQRVPAARLSATSVSPIVALTLPISSSRMISSRF